MSQNGKCYRCGRTGHWANNCYAKSHVNGYGLESSGSKKKSSRYNKDR